MLPMQYHPHPHQYDLDGEDDDEDEDEEVHPDGTSVLAAEVAVGAQHQP